MHKMDKNTQIIVLCAIYFLLHETEAAILKSGNNKMIKKCSKCPPGWGTVKNCARNFDTQCISCIQGKTYSPHYSSKSSCWSCSQCGIGLYESHVCSPVRDTICSECVSYLDHINFINNHDFFKKCTYLFLK